MISGCSCDPEGTFADLTFNASDQGFICAGQEFVEDEDFPWATAGFVEPDGAALTAFQVDILNASYVLVCSKVSSCEGRSSARSSPQSAGEAERGDAKHALEQQMYRLYRGAE